MPAKSLILGRRNFCLATVASILGARIVSLRFRTDHSLIPIATSEEFVIVNGWVLTREDGAATGIVRDVF
jgi:drug/metabolite transporter superfamily protein YnfA